MKVNEGYKDVSNILNTTSKPMYQQRALRFKHAGI